MRLAAVKLPEKLKSPSSSKSDGFKGFVPNFSKPFVLPATIKVDLEARSYISGIVADVQKKMKARKEDATMTGLLHQGDIQSHVREWIPTGIPTLDFAYGGGLPVGRESEIFGPAMSGKSAQMHLCIKAAQSVGGFALLNDFERALDPDKMARLKIDPERLVYNQPDTIEQGLDIFRYYMDRFKEKPWAHGPLFFGWDSIAASPAHAEFFEDSAEDAHVAAQARAMGRVFRALTLRLPRIRAHFMLINQEREGIGGFSPNPMMKPKVTPGGGAAKYFASLRVRCSRIKTLKEGNMATGYLIQSQTDKSRVVPPHRKVVWCLDFEYGPSPELTLFHTLMEAREIKSAGAGKYSWNAINPVFDRHEWVQLLRTDAQIRTKAAQQAVELARAQMGGDEE